MVDLLHMMKAERLSRAMRRRRQQSKERPASEFRVPDDHEASLRRQWKTIEGYVDDQEGDLSYLLELKPDFLRKDASSGKSTTKGP